MILGYGLWARRYGGDPSIVGRRIRLDGLDQTVVGDPAESFRLWLPSEAFLITDSQIWKPLQFNYANQPPRNFTLFTVFGRLKPGVTLRAGAGGDGRASRGSCAREHPVHESATCASASCRCRTTWSSTRGRRSCALFVAVGSCC